MATLAALDVADPPEVWRALGFAVEGGVVAVGGVAIRLGQPGTGLTGVLLGGAGALDELPAARPPAHPAPVRPGSHPNGAVAVDHLVVRTPDLQRTAVALEGAGVALRRTRPAGELVQAFFLLDNAVVEVVAPAGPPEPGPATPWGVTFAVADLDAAAALLGPALRPARAAVQPGRRIATVDRRAGSSVPLALMTPLVRGAR